MGVGPSSEQFVAVFRPPADEAGEFGVEDIIDHSIIQGVMQYLVKWRGCSLFEAMWEPRENLTHC